MVASGLFCLGPSIFASAALILTIFANSVCNFATPNTQVGNYNMGDIGLWCYSGYRTGTDLKYGSIPLDSKYDDARAFSITAACIGGLVYLFYIAASCVRFGGGSFKWAGAFALIACLFQGLVFLFLQNDYCVDGCSLTTGANCAIAATVLWFVTGVFSFGAGKEKEEEGNSDENRGMEEPLVEEA